MSFLRWRRLSGETPAPSLRPTSGANLDILPLMTLPGQNARWAQTYCRNDLPDKNGHTQATQSAASQAMIESSDTVIQLFRRPLIMLRILWHFISLMMIAKIGYA